MLIQDPALDRKERHPVERIWLESYPQGVPADINPDQYKSVIELFDQTVKRYADCPAFYNLGTTLTFRQIDTYSRAFAAFLQQDLKLKKGDRIAIMFPNVLQYPIILFAALRAGLIVVNVNPLYTAAELGYQLRDSGAETIVVLANFANTVEQVTHDTPLKNIIVSQIGDLLPAPKGLIINLILKYIHKKVPAWNIPNAIQFKKALEKGKKSSLQPVELNNEDIAFLQYTGGTTGISKGAMLTHRNIIANIKQAEAWFGPILERGKEIVITALPLYHIFSLTANCLFMGYMGSLNVLITNPRDIPRMIQEMAKFKFTAITGVNTLFNALMNAPSFLQLDFSHLKLTLGGGAAVQKAVADKWQEMTGDVLLEAYGLTETSPCVTLNPTTLKAFNGSIGLPAPSTDICILDDVGNEVPPGKPGELAVKGPQVMKGYWQNSYETQKVFTKDGWLLTGDVASIDEQGFVRLLERKKDMILVSGFNVYPNEVEDILVRMPEVKEAAVIGIPNAHSGESIKAFIVKQDPHLTEEKVLSFCHKYLTKYKIPKEIEFRAELPKSNVGKILRRVLRDERKS